jgi:hypothetical protein
LTTSVDFVEQAGIETNQFTFLLQHMYDITKECQDSFTVFAGTPSGLIPNVTSISYASLFKMANDCKPAGFFHENRGTSIVEYPYATGFKTVVLLSDTMYAGNPNAMQFWEYRVWPAISDTTGVNAGRLFRVSLASFLCYQHSGVSYFHFGKNDRDYWFSGHGIDLGTPLVHYDSLVYANGGRVFFRRYTKGIVIYRPKMGITTDGTTLYINHDSLGLGDTVLCRFGEHYGGVSDTLDFYDIGQSIPIDTQDGWFLTFAGIPDIPLEPEIFRSPSYFNFVGTIGDPNPDNQILTINNSGGGTLNWTVSDTSSWLTLGPTSGTNSGLCTLYVSLSGLSADTLFNTLTISDPNAVIPLIDVPIRFIVSNEPPPPTPSTSPHIKVRY